MGAYWSLKVNDFEIASGKSFLDPRLTVLFSEADRRSFRKNEGGYRHTVHVYAASVSDTIQRLELHGFTARQVKLCFEKGIKYRLEEIARNYGERDGNDDRIFQAEVSRLNKLSYPRWLSGARGILSKKLRPVFHNEPFPDSATSAERAILSSAYGSDLHYGFPWVDQCLLLRAFCEAASNEMEVSLDLTDLVESGYINVRERHSDSARELLVNRYVDLSPILVLTEGSSDARALSASLAILFPRLAHIFSFVDFGVDRPPGGVGPVINLLKGLAASGIPNSMIGLFDHDVAARAALKHLVLSRPNVKVITLPKYDLLQNYPTLGPQGRQKLNVNGLAASIELYMGVDVLKDDRGRLLPVQWGSYEKTLKRYQGEVIEKEQIKKRFWEKVRTAKSHGVQGQDWEGMKLVCERLISAAKQLRRFSKSADGLLIHDY